jgi:hypothetical protein
MSCDKNKDILKHLLLSFKKFNNNTFLQHFIGINSNLNQLTNEYTEIITPKSNWREESIFQIKEIKSKFQNITHLIVILDDFILNNNVDQISLNSIINDPSFDKIKYLRLKKIEEPIFIRIYNYFIKKSIIGNSKLIKIRKSHPYYFSLQIAIWDINYLLNAIINSKDIWHFENQKPSDIDHFSIQNNIFHYKHIVEKGKWQFYADKYCINYLGYFNPGTRPMLNNNFKNNCVEFLKRVKFYFFGYIKLNNK